MIPIDIDDYNIDFCMSSAQKGLMAMTGLSFIIGNREMIIKSKDYPKRSYYCNLYRQYHHFESTGEMHFTPPVQTVYAAAQAIRSISLRGTGKMAKASPVFEAIHRFGKARFQGCNQARMAIRACCCCQYPDDPNWNFEKSMITVTREDLLFIPGKFQVRILLGYVH